MRIITKFMYVIDQQFVSLARLAWSPLDSFTFKFSASYQYGSETYMLINSELLTPFEDLLKTSISGGYKYI